MAQLNRKKVDNSAVGERSKQTLSCNWTGTADFGRLVPIHWEELLQGDHVINFKPRIEMQLLPLASPTFGKIDLYCHAFVVPLRQLWDSFYEFWSHTGVGKNKQIPTFSYYDLAQSYYNDLQSDSNRRAAFKHWTSLGLNPCFAFDAVPQNPDADDYNWDMPFRCYNKIWWDFYRDPEVLRDESKSNYLYTGDSSIFAIDQDAVNKFAMPHLRSIKDNWIADLFAQSGDSPVYDDSVFNEGSNFPYNNGIGSPADLRSDGLTPYSFNPDDEQVEVSGNSSRMTRLIEALTRMSERLSLSGKREIEALFARYGIKPKWAEMNLSRYVGGSKSTVIVDNIISNADTTDGNNGSPLGAKAGTGYCAMDDFNLEVSVDEPSILMVICSVMPHVHFVQGISRKWHRKELQDMFQSDLQHVGQVAVARREVAKKYRSFQSYLNNEDGRTFAFCDPYYEYKMGQDILAGDFMWYHNVVLGQDDDREKRDILYMQSMEQYIDFPYNRNFNLNNLVVDGDQFNKIFSYLGGSIWEDVDDHFHISIEKELVIDRPMDDFGIGTLETTEDPHAKKQTLSSDTQL